MNDLLDAYSIHVFWDYWDTAKLEQRLRDVTSVELDSILDTRLAAAYAGPNGELTVVGLDRQGGQLNDASATVVPYAVGGLPESATFRLLEWNRDGDGRNADAGTVTSDEAGVAQFGIPQQGMFALTNISSPASF